MPLLNIPCRKINSQSDGIIIGRRKFRADVPALFTDAEDDLDLVVDILGKSRIIEITIVFQ